MIPSFPHLKNKNFKNGQNLYFSSSPSLLFAHQTLDANDHIYLITVDSLLPSFPTPCSEISISSLQSYSTDSVP